jgi:hypothetical protein
MTVYKNKDVHVVSMEQEEEQSFNSIHYMDKNFVADHHSGWSLFNWFRTMQGRYVFIFVRNDEALNELTAIGQKNPKSAKEAIFAAAVSFGF